MRSRRDLPILVVAVALSALGDFVALIALGLHVHDMTQDGFAVSAVMAALMCPVVLLAPLAGLLVDRVENTRLLAAVSMVSAAVAVGLAFAGSLAVLLVLAVALGSAQAVSQTAEFALLPAVAGEEDLARANGTVESARYVGFTVGPLLGGLLSAGGGARAALLVDAASFVVIAVGALALVARRRPARPIGGAPDRARDGYVHLMRDRDLRIVVWVVTVALLFMSMSITADVFFARDVLHAGGIGYGALVTTWAVAMLLGSLLVAPRIATGGLAVAAVLATALQGSGKLAGAAGATLVIALAGYAAGGLAHGVRNVLARTLIHERVPDRLRGRAFAAFSGMRNTAELGALALGGAAVAAFGPRAALAIAGGGMTLTGLAGLALLRGLGTAPVARPASVLADE